MSDLALACGLILPWFFGWALLRALDWPRPVAAGRPGVQGSLRLGYGYFLGILLLTLWMRALSMAGIGFGRLSIGLPLLAAAAALLAWGARRSPLSWDRLGETARLLLRPPLPRWQKLVWQLLLAWLAVRLALLAAEVAWRPLYPWDAWVQWATKARVWYELGRIVPFVRADAWLAGAPGAYFDASPNYPATVPLLQVWSCIALGRWDDSAMNWPWLLDARRADLDRLRQLARQRRLVARRRRRGVPRRLAAPARRARRAGRLRRSHDGRGLHALRAGALPLVAPARSRRRRARHPARPRLPADQGPRR